MNLDTLNETQLEAVKITDGPLLILAGPGSGKTRVITYKIAYLLEQGKAKPWEVLAITFTNKAAKEMKERLHNLIEEDIKGMQISTFHSFLQVWIPLQSIRWRSPWRAAVVSVSSTRICRSSSRQRKSTW